MAAGAGSLRRARWLAPLAPTIGIIAIVVFAAILAGYAIKALTAFAAVRADFRHPIAGNLLERQSSACCCCQSCWRLIVSSCQATWTAGAIGMILFAWSQWGMDLPGNKEIQFDLHANYGSNVERYVEWHDYFRRFQPPVLIVWGKNDFVFLPEGAEAYRKFRATRD